MRAPSHPPNGPCGAFEGSTAGTVAATIAEREQIRDALRREDEPAAAAELCERLLAATARIAALRERALAQRFDVVARINESLAALHAATTVPELLERAAVELCRCCGFDRAVISRVHGSSWKAEVVHAVAPSDPDVDRETRAFLDRESIPLERTLLETELVRRRVAALISDPTHDEHAFAPMIEATSTRGYVAAPVMPAGRVIGFLHADCYDSGRELTVADRDHLWIFAEGFGPVFESLVLGERLAEQRERTLAAVREVEREIAELCEAEVSLGDRTGAGPATVLPPLPHGRGADPADLLLTLREREVLDLMATGARNQQIADQLALAESTVKSHVMRARRKLRAANRAEAVSRYLQLTAAERR